MLFEKIVHKGAIYTKEEINDMSRVNVSYVFSIWKAKLTLRKVCTRRILHFLTFDYKKKRVESKIYFNFFMIRRQIKAS
jgi:hypothetical protein